MHFYEDMLMNLSTPTESITPGGFSFYLFIYFNQQPSDRQ